MITRIIGTYLTILCCQSHLLQAAEMELAAYPTSIKAGLTNKLQLRCSLQLNRATGGTLQSGAKQFQGTVNSISVTRDSKILVAKISTMNSKIVSDEGTVTALGNLTAYTSYLQMTWTKPGISQSGIYRCEINATDNAGQNLVYRSNIYVCYQRPNEEDIIQYINELEERLKTELRDARTASNNSQANLQGQIDNLKTVGINNNAVLQRLETGVSSLRNNVTAIQNTLGSYVVEQGFKRFGYSAGFYPAGDGTTRKLIANVKFTKIFSKVPTVICNLQSLDGEKGTNTRFKYYITDLTTAGFSLHFETWHDTIFYGSEVKWTASIP